MNSQEQRVLVLGSSGQVGRHVVQALAGRPGPPEVVAASRADPDPGHRFDLALPATVDRLINEIRPTHVFHLAAATNVQWCEEHPKESWTANVLCAEAAASAARTVAATLTFVSTDYVFDGTGGPYGEADETNPINVYGTHKLAAEEAVMAASPSNLVVRSCQVFGGDPRRMNFVLKVVDALRRGEVVSAGGHLFGTPTYAPDLAHALAELSLTGESGVWHVAGGAFVSRCELARRAAAAFGCDGAKIVEVTADQMHDPVNRPRRAGLRDDRLAAAGFEWITPLDAALAALAQQEMLR